ncbi:MAG TPA: glycine dehydrogenase (aminomethyl-transferring), partial [Myxococcaceae bacterium]|nr:glycine dehydrogenase (aminomethyl-transferring) [Myxococcaceae bacterium]
MPDSRTPSETDSFPLRHIGPDAADVTDMLRVVGAPTLQALVDQTLPANIRLARGLDLPPAVDEARLLEELEALGARNQVFRSFIGQGYSDTFVPPVILRNVFQNPGWYTQYTPYQPEISQGRLEALLNFQTMVIDLTGLPVANASLLDEGTAAAEAMHLFEALAKPGHDAFFVSDKVHPQTLEVVRTRAGALGIPVIVGDHRTFDFSTKIFGALVQYPATDGLVDDYASFFDRVHSEGAHAAVATDLLALTVLTPPGELGADVAVGSAQRFGVPMGYGGPHAAFFAVKQEFTRLLPGRIIGVSEDAQGHRALRMALQTREQHIRREKATSNICTAQAFLAVMASFYAAWHGPEGLKAIATRVHALTVRLGRGLTRLGFKLKHANVFDTLRLEMEPAEADRVMARARDRKMNLRRLDARSVGISLD